MYDCTFYKTVLSIENLPYSKNNIKFKTDSPLTHSAIDN